MSDPKLFYSAHVFCCTNRRPDGHKRGSCAARGSEQLRNYMKAQAKEMGWSRISASTPPAAWSGASWGRRW